jgi:hypothetical protein
VPTAAEQLEVIKTQALATIAEITASPKPSYAIDGQSVSWNEYLKQLQEIVSWCDGQSAASTPFEFQTQART